MSSLPFEPGADLAFMGEPGEDLPLKYEAVEVFLVGADETGIWALQPDAPYPWSSPPVRQLPGVLSAEHVAAQLELIQHGVDLAAVPVLHSTSWRSEPSCSVYHYLAVVDCPGTVREHWPEAKPVSPNIARVAGQPKTHGAAAPPEEVRYIDILRHAIRHLRALTDPAYDEYDATITRDLPAVWFPRLEGIRPATARMFDRVHQGA